MVFTPAGGGKHEDDEFVPPVGDDDGTLHRLVTEFVRDERGNVTKVTYADGSSEESTYDEDFSVVTSTTDRFGSVVNYTLDAYGHATSVVEEDSLGNAGGSRTTEFVYTTAPTAIEEEAGGLVTERIVAAGSSDAITTGYVYGDAGTLHVGLLTEEIVAPDTEFARRVQYGYDELRHRTSVTDPAERVTQYAYDRLGRLLSVTSPDPDGEGALTPLVTRYEYDANGNLVAEIDPANASRALQGEIPDEAKTLYEYDGRNRLKKTTLPTPGGDSQSSQQRLETTRTYDADGRLATETDAAGNVVTHSFDQRGQLIRSEASAAQAPSDATGLLSGDGGAAVKVYFYDRLGNLVAENDGKDEDVLSYRRYDELGRLIYTISAESDEGEDDRAVSRVVYDDEERTVSTYTPSPTGQGESVSTVEYDSFGRTIKSIAPADHAGVRAETTYAYAKRDQILTETNVRGETTTYEYDALGQVKSVQGADAADRVEYQYDVSGNRTHVADGPVGDQRTTVHEYDSLNRLVKSTLPDPDGDGAASAVETRYLYDALGRQYRTESRTTAGTLLDYDESSFDWLGRAWFSTSTPVVAKDDQGQDVTFTPERRQIFDDRGFVGKTIRKRTDSDELVTEFFHDSYGRVVLAKGPADDEGRQAQELYAYDPLGQLLKSRDADGLNVVNEYDDRHQLVKKTLPTPGGTSDYSWKYNSAGFATETTDLIGRTFEAKYDGSGSLIESLGPSVAAGQPKSTAKYDQLANETVETQLLADGETLTTTTRYDEAGRTVEVRVAGGGLADRITAYAYDARGRVASVTDPTGVVTRYAYDAWDRVTRTVRVESGASLYDAIYDDDDAVYSTPSAWTEVSDVDSVDDGFRELTADGQTAHTATFTIAGLSAGKRYGLLVSWKVDPANADAVRWIVSDGSGALADVVIDQSEAPAGFSDGDRAWAALSAFAYTGGALTVVLDASDSEGTVRLDAIRVVELAPGESVEYDDRGNVILSRNGEWETTRYEYDAWNRLVRQIDPEGGETAYEYDVAGNLAAIRDPEGNVTRYAYDRLGRRVGEAVVVDGQTLTRSYAYDVAGNLVRFVDREGRVREYERDVYGRVTQETWIVGGATVNEIEYTYDAAGRLTSIADTLGLDANSYTYVYDALDRVTSTTSVFAGGPTVTLADTYDRLDGLRSSSTATVGSTVDYTNQYDYDRFGRTTSIAQIGSGIQSKAAAFVYDSSQRLSEIHRYESADGTEFVAKTTFAYDGESRLIDLHHFRGAATLNRYQFAYDAADRLIRSISYDGVVDYQYDGLGQLSDADWTGATTAPDESYAYDANGNRIGGGHVTGDHNRLESDGTYDYEYDAEGNRTRKTEISSGDYTTYVWDQANRLIAVEEYDSLAVLQKKTTYAYDVFGRRIGKQVDEDGDATVDRGQRFVYDSQSKTDGAGHAVADVVLVFDEKGVQTDGVWSPRSAEFKGPFTASPRVA